MSDVQIYGGAWGRELKADNSRAGVVDDGNVAWPERIAQAATQWPQADVADFEPVGKRRWRDKATGVEYKEESGAPLLGIGTDSTRFIACFFVLDGRLTFLARSDIDQGKYIRHGEFYAAEVIDGQIVKSA